MRKVLFTTACALALSNATAQQQDPPALIYKDGAAILGKVQDSIIVTVSFKKIKHYGKYLVASIYIQNNSSNTFTFFPDSIEASFTHLKRNTPGKVFTSAEYMKRVRHRQNFSATMAGAAEGLNRGVAQSSTSTIRSYDYTTGAVSKTTITTTQLPQTAPSSQSTDLYNAMNRDRKTISSTYLHTNTLSPGDSTSGYLNIKWHVFKNMTLTIPVNGTNFTFQITSDLVQTE